MPTDRYHGANLKLANAFGRERKTGVEVRPCHRVTLQGWEYPNQHRTTAGIGDCGSLDADQCVSTCCDYRCTRLTSSEGASQAVLTEPIHFGSGLGRFVFFITAATDMLQSVASHRSAFSPFQK